MKNFQFADLHCHPNLKTFGKSFSTLKRIRDEKSSLWYSNPPNFISKCFQKLTGITKFSQADFSTMANSNVKIAFVSLYPYEKEFFKHSKINNKISAFLASFITSIGYKRVRHVQMHTDYFKDLMDEYEFLMQFPKSKIINNTKITCGFVVSQKEIESNLEIENHISIIPTIEGAHVLNSGLSKNGKTLDEDEIFKNIEKLKKLPFPPLFITFAHNFNNGFCGHAPSLEPLGRLVDQSKNLHAGFSTLGLKVLNKLLSNSNGKPIFIDVKHMSLKSRFQYYDLLETKYNNAIPIIVSHGAVTGRDTFGNINSSLNADNFANDSINFRDEELIKIAKSSGIFAIQLDSKRLAPAKLIKKSIFKNNKTLNLKKSTLLIWRQMQHIAEILDQNALNAWDFCCVGSDFDGTINPLEEIWTMSDFNPMANELLLLVETYLSEPNALIHERNKNILAEKVVSNFTINNILKFFRHLSD